MNDTTKRALGLLAAAGALGLLGDAWLRAGPWGLNLFLWIGALTLGIVYLARRQRIPLTWGGRWLLPAAVLFAAGFAWRDSPTLKALDGCAVFILLSLAIQRARSGRLSVAGVMEYPVGLVVTAFASSFGGLLLLSNDITWSDLPRGGRLRQAGAVGRGMLFALPLLLVFGALFASADAVFDGMVSRLFRVDTEACAGHLGVLLLGAWLAVGYLRALLLHPERDAPEETRQAVSLGAIEVLTVLAMLDLLFLLFVLVQLRFFFGGDPLVQVTPHLTYADYARGGFFELVAVAALTLPLLLGAHWLLPRDSVRGERLFRGLAGVMVGLLFVIIASALQRMRLYQMGYGMTELRLYTTAFIGWLAVVFLWFAATVLRGRRERFAWGALVAAFLTIGALHALNPDALIVRVNAGRIAQGRRFDTDYPTRLSADAVPALLAALPGLPREPRADLARHLLERYPARLRPDWRIWSWSQAQARCAVAGREAALRGWAAEGGAT